MPRPWPHAVPGAPVSLCAAPHSFGVQKQVSGSTAVAGPWRWSELQCHQLRDRLVQRTVPVKEVDHALFGRLQTLTHFKQGPSTFHPLAMELNDHAPRQAFKGKPLLHEHVDKKEIGIGRAALPLSPGV